MSLADLARRLESSFRISERLLTRLLAGLQQRRTSWVSARPGTVAPPQELEACAAELRAEDGARAAIVEELKGLLRLPIGVSPRDLHVDVTRLCAELPPLAGRSLRAAADAATAIATRVRTELALGRRLLGFAQRAQDSLVAELGARPHEDKSNGYDRNARASRGLGHGVATGGLVDGRI